MHDDTAKQTTSSIKIWIPGQGQPLADYLEAVGASHRGKSGARPTCAVASGGGPREALSRGGPEAPRAGGRSELVQATGDWLSTWQWDIFGHLTFAGRPPREDYANREFIRHFIRPVNEHLYGKRWQRKGEGVLVARAWEYGKQTHRGHYHFLASSGCSRELARMQRKQLWKAWSDEVGHASIGAYDPNKGARFYLGKEYLAKGGCIDYLGPLWKWEAARTHQPRMI